MNSNLNSTPPYGGRQGPVRFPCIQNPIGIFGPKLPNGGDPALQYPSRTIPPKRGSLSGHIPFQQMGRVVWFESSLERDFLRSLKPFEGVLGILEQPVPLDRKKLGFGKGRYRPDFLVWVLADCTPCPKPVLVEIKYEEELRSEWSTIRPKLMAGRRFAQQQGWRFQLFTPRHLRIPCPLPHITSGERYKPYQLVEPQQVLERLFGSDFVRRLS